MCMCVCVCSSRMQVKSIREYLDAFEANHAQTKERLAMVEIKLAAEGERTAQTTAQAMEMRAELDGLASSAKVSGGGALSLR